MGNLTLPSAPGTNLPESPGISTGGGGGPVAISDVTGLEAALAAAGPSVFPVGVVAEVDNEAAWLGATGAAYAGFITTEGSSHATVAAIDGDDLGAVKLWTRNAASSGTAGSDFWDEGDLLSVMANLGKFVTAVVWGDDLPAVGQISVDVNTGNLTLRRLPLNTRQRADLLAMIEDPGSAVNDAIEAIVAAAGDVEAIVHEATEYLVGGPVEVSAIIDCFGLADPVMDGSAPPALGVYDSELAPGENVLYPWVGSSVAAGDFILIANPITPAFAGFWKVGTEDPENPGTWLPFERPADSYVMYNGFTYGDLKALAQAFVIFEGSRGPVAGGAMYQGKRTGSGEADWSFQYMTGGGTHVALGNSQNAIIPPWVHEVRVQDGENVVLLDSGVHCAVWNAGTEPVSVRKTDDTEIASVAAGARKHFRNANQYGNWIHDADWGIDS